MRFSLAALSAVCLLFPFSFASAQDYNTLLDIPEGSTLISLSATERVEIEQDLLTANLRIEKEDANAKKVQDEINAIMAKALEEAKAVSSVKVATQQYHVYQYDRSGGDKARRDMVWKGQQGLQIKGKAAADVLALVAKLQESGLTVSGLSYSVSPELLEETRDALLEDALKKLQAKAERAAKALGKSEVEMLQVNVDIGGYYPAPMMARASVMMDSASAKAEMAVPVAAPGESEVNLTVSANALLK